MSIKNLFIQPEWPAPTNIYAYTALRASNISHLGEKKINGNLLRELLNLPNDPIWLKQIHSNNIVSAQPENLYCEADASFTNVPNQVCAVLTADCLPLLICDKQGKEVAAVHAGWRGLANGIIEKTIQTFNAQPHELLVWLGPAIGPNKFEIRKDVYDIFTQANPLTNTCFTPLNSEQWLANIYQLATLQLQGLGISQIYGGNFCTHTEADKFFSYRREGNGRGQIVSLIWLEN